MITFMSLAISKTDPLNSKFQFYSQLNGLFSIDPESEIDQQIKSLIFDYFKPKIAILGVSQELGALDSMMKGPVRRIENSDIRQCYQSDLWDHNTVVMVIKAGKIAAASAVVDLIVTHNVDVIINFGTSASLVSRLNVGDMVIAEESIQYDADFRSAVPKPFVIPQTASRPHIMHDLLKQQALCAAKKFFEQDFNVLLASTNSLTDRKALRGMVGTADCFLISDQQRANLKEHAPNVLCIDMETAPASQTAQAYQIPFVSVRIISNIARGATPPATSTEQGDKVVQEEYEKFVQRSQIIYAQNTLRHFFLGINNLLFSLQEVTEYPLSTEVKTFRAGIICTSEEEAKTLIQLFQNSSMNQFGGKKYHFCQKDAIQAVVVASGIGKVAVAACATELVKRYKVNLLLNIGSVKPPKKSTRKEGDIVAVSYAMQFDMDVRPIRPLFALAGVGKIQFQACERFNRIFRSIVPESLLIPIASGDRFFESIAADVVKEIPAEAVYDDASGSIAQVGFQYNTSFAVIKRITSDPNNYRSLAGAHNIALQVFSVFLDSPCEKTGAILSKL